ncbi:MAG: hypothetical protein EOM73_11555 [Bacteroidia bacterium]|nr:hypothetical protein [Bacteroidia bacterium]
MATQKQLKALEKARKAKANKGKGISGILSGFGLANPAKITQKEAFDILKDGAMLFLGFAGGQIAGAIVKKHIVKDATDWKRYVEPAIVAGGGILLSATGRNNQMLRMMGQGMIVSSVVTGVSLVTKKSLLELVGMNEGTAGLGKAIEDIEEIKFDARLPEFQGPGEDAPLLGDDVIDTSKMQ